ncbi:MAG: ABC transporter ATP-binding protein [Betaproteobacteria bacterium]|nr:ABC transporter ATP-binding protein [Betaproteobacteria bacterium]
MLEVRNLRIALPDRSRKPVFGAAPLLEILKGIDLSVAPGETIGLVGESGSGKSTLARALLRLYRPSAGRIVFEGQDITDLPESALRPLRARMQIVFQDSQSALNPRLTVGTALAEPFLSYGRARGSREALRLAAGLLEHVGLAPAMAARYPHQLSGGQRQRVGIARAIALNPALVVADEIVSGLDVSVQAQILELLRALRSETGMALVLISHDLSVVRALCEKVVVMQHGVIVESGLSAEVFAAPQHPYTRKLLRAIPLPEVDPAWIDTVDVDEG